MRKTEEADFSVSHDENEYRNALEWCEKYLLRQGPLEYFVHHNTLHAFESEEFFKGLFKAKDLFGARTLMPISWFQEEYKKGRISMDDLSHALDKHSQNSFELTPILEWNELYPKVKNPLRDKFINEFLKNTTERSSSFAQITTFWDFTKHPFRSKSLEKTLENLKFKFLAAFFDKGTSYWEMEDREKGLDYCFQNYLKYLPTTKINKAVQKAYKDLNYQKQNLLPSLEEIKSQLNIPIKHLNKYLFQVLNKSKGWTGLVYSLNENTNFNPTRINAKKDDYVILSLTFELAAFHILKESNDLDFITYQAKKSNNYQKEILSFLYDHLKKETKGEALVREKFLQNREEYLSWDLQKISHIWQDAYERHLIMDLVETHQQAKVEDPMTPLLQVVTCIDDREESTRRHFEEFSPLVQTFGYAGHFGLNILYRSLRDAHFRALCPVNANPSKYVFEEVVPGEKISFQKLAKIKHFLFHNSNLPLVGSILSLLLGPFTGMLFLFENLTPKLVHTLRKKLKLLMFPHINTRLNYSSREENDLEGYSDEELADAASNMITITGLNKDWGKIVFLCGHGSKSMNNPHGAAYNCGACAGGKGAPNARLMATALNKASIRTLLLDRGLEIPEKTSFIGGYHCTSTGKVLIFEDSSLSKEQKEFLKESCHYVEKKDAKERMRKFENVPLTVNEDEAFLAAQNRSYDFSQPRPEYGHNTNAFCLVGDRKTSQSLFMDRRAFLVSYDDSNDPEGDYLLSLLSAVIPVCAGISLEYYFSFVDQEKFGAGVKQAHNVVSLMGVMNGYQSDLQMGLPWQMVEIHEPARITFLVEANQEKFERVLDRNLEVKNLVKNEWVRLILKVPTGEYLLYGQKNPNEIKPTSSDKAIFKNSVEIYEGKREILNLALKKGVK